MYDYPYRINVLGKIYGWKKLKTLGAIFLIFMVI